MRDRRVTAMSVLVLLGCGLALVPGFAVGQEAAGSANAWTSPRTLWGDPDLQGIWDSKTLTPMERPEKFAAREYLTDEEDPRGRARGGRRPPTPGEEGAGGHCGPGDGARGGRRPGGCRGNADAAVGAARVVEI